MGATSATIERYITDWFVAEDLNVIPFGPVIANKGLRDTGGREVSIGLIIDNGIIEDGDCAVVA